VSGTFNSPLLIQKHEMITFATTSNPTGAGGQLVYRRNDMAFATEPGLDGRGISVVINEVELFVDDSGRVISVSGYCPYQGWRHTSFSPPKHDPGVLTVVGLHPSTEPDGMAFGLNDVTNRWPVHVNAEGWVCIGDPANSGDEAVEFAPNSVAVLREDQIVALWLCPTMIGGDV